MKISDVPQDRNLTLQGERKAVYAVDEQGRYRVIASSGWEVEETVTSLAVDHYRELAQNARSAVMHGELAPLAYHLHARRYQVVTLAQATGFFQWQVRRHCRPRVFAQLNKKVLARYADALGMSIQQLQVLPVEK